MSSLKYETEYTDGKLPKIKGVKVLHAVVALAVSLGIFVSSEVYDQVKCNQEKLVKLELKVTRLETKLDWLIDNQLTIDPAIFGSAVEFD